MICTLRRVCCGARLGWALLFVGELGDWDSRCWPRLDDVMRSNEAKSVDVGEESAGWNVMFRLSSVKIPGESRISLCH